MLVSGIPSLMAMGPIEEGRKSISRPSIQDRSVDKAVTLRRLSAFVSFSIFFLPLVTGAHRATVCGLGLGHNIDSLIAHDYSSLPKYERG